MQRSGPRRRSAKSVRITTLAEYGVICALHLARRVDEGPITGREIAERRDGCPPTTSSRSCFASAAPDIVRSTRGARGGYALARPADGDLDSRRDRGVGDDDVRSALRVASGGRRALLVVARRAAFDPCGCCFSGRSTTCSRAFVSPICSLEEVDVRTRVGLADLPEPAARALPVLQH